MGEWISVEDELPAEQQDVLVLRSNGAIEIKYLANVNGFVVGTGEKKRALVWYPDGSFGLHTHWMPLPEPPE